MSWVTVTEDDIFCLESEAQVHALTSKLKPGAVASLILEQIDAIRSAAACCEKNQALPSDSSLVPRGAVTHIRYLVLKQLYSSSRAKKADIDDLYSKACAYLEKLSKCEVILAPPTNPISSGMKVIKEKFCPGYTKGSRKNDPYFAGDRRYL